jgi:hypothetical protein
VSELHSAGQNAADHHVPEGVASLHHGLHSTTCWKTLRRSHWAWVHEQ